MEPLENRECCRTCLSIHNLNPIFSQPEYCEKYSEVLLCCTGIKVQLNDLLPQLMCTECINFINRSYKFRKKCENAQKTLIERLNQKSLHEIKIEIEPCISKSDTVALLDITDLKIDNDFRDYDDNITLNNYNVEVEKNKEEKIYQNIETKENTQNYYNARQAEENNDHSDHESSRNGIKNKTTHKERAKKRGRTKKENQEEKRTKEKKERVKEEIQCELCHKILTSKLSLRNHNKIHTGFDVVCEHCGKKFITRRLLLMHCKAKHGYEKTDKCSYCEYKASNAEQVKIHERLHTGEKPYVCERCDARFHRKSSYLQHVAIHLPDKTVQCDQCPARFKSTTLMRIHRARHRAPPYSYTCRVCLNTFARRRNVARHLLRIHSLQPATEHIDRTKRTR